MIILKFIRVNKEGNIKNGIVFKEKLYFLEDIYKKEIELIEFIKIFDLNEEINDLIYKYKKNYPDLFKKLFTFFWIFYLYTNSKTNIPRFSHSLFDPKF